MNVSANAQFRMMTAFFVEFANGQKNRQTTTKINAQQK